MDDRGFDLIWGVKGSFVRYLASVPDTAVALDDGAAEFRDGGAWRFPGAGMRITGDPWAEGSAEYDFTGSLRIDGHGGMMAVRIIRPRLTLADGEAVLSVEDEHRASERHELARAALDSERRRGDGSAAFDLRLTGLAAMFGGSYPLGTPLAPAVLVPAGAS